MTKKILPLIVLSAALVFVSCVPMKEYYETGSRPVDIHKNDVSPEKEGGKSPGKIGEVPFKVLLHRSGWGVIIKSKDKIRVKGHDKIPGMKKCVVKIKDSRINLGGYEFPNESIELVSSSPMEFDGKRFRGSFIIKKKKGELLLINNVWLSQYLYGVLPAEVPPGWHSEALKAQAVAARTFAVNKKINNKSKDYDLNCTVLSQVYKGLDIEHEKTNRAVDETEGRIISYRGDVIQAFFHANSGGKTASSEEVWGGRLKYLKSVRDRYAERGSHYSWEAGFKPSEISEALSKKGIETGEIYKIKVMDRSESGRVEKMSIVGSSGRKVMKGKDFRNGLGVNKLRSTNFDVTGGSGIFLFKGYGWGHGVGLSQEGAKEMAERGRPYKDILSHFYPGTKVVKTRMR